MNIKLCIVAVMLSLLAVSCKKILQPDTPSVFSQQYVFSSEADANKAVNGVYALFNTDAYTSRVSNAFAPNTDVEAGGASAAPDNSRRDIWTYETTNSNGDLLTVWNNAYNTINRANECIEGINASVIANTKGMKQLKGEVLTLRAYWYYLLINNWGDVPFKITPTKAGDEFYLPKTPRDSILSHIIKDLIDIEPEMYWASELDFGIERINREFVMGMIARLSLMRGGYWLYPDMTMKRKADYLDYYKIANTYCKKLIELKPHQLSSFSTVFTNVNKNVKPTNDDVLYEVAFQPGFGDVGWNIGVVVAAGVHSYGASSVSMFLTPAYYHSFDTTDTRLPVTCSIVNYDANLLQQPSAPTAIAMGKWNRLLVPTPLGSASTKGTGINFPLMRYSDVLLMLAESENEISGPTNIAQDALKKVRQRAFPSSVWADKVDSYVASVSGGKSSFFDAIVNERAWEFGGECTRRFDLSRWNLFGKKIAELKKTLTDMGQDAIGGVGTYSNLPDYQYYKIDSASKTITFLSKYKKPAIAPPVKNMPNVGDNPNGYLRTNWLRSLSTTTTPTGPATYILYNWRGYSDNTGTKPVRYILPIHSSVISSSLGVLKNDGYGY